MTDFAVVDPILMPWAEKHELHVYRRDRSPALRSLIVYYWLGTHHESAGHMWLECGADDQITVHGSAPDWHNEKTVSLAELESTLEDMLPKLMGCHYHEAIDPAWFGLWDFKVLLLRKPGETPRPTITNAQGYRWYSQR